MKLSLIFVSVISALLIASVSDAKTVRYELTVENKPMNLSGNKTVDFALTVNGGIPAPTLEFTEGDDAEILVINKLPKEEVSIHWHGLLLPPEQDGVAYVNTPPIYAGQSHLFKFKIRQHGTYWYHSHTAVQEQKGVYGAFIIHPKQKTLAYDRDLVLILSDWSDENADAIIRNLRKDGDYYLYKKDSVRSYFGALGAGGLQTHLSNEWQKMGGMDLSDVGYDAFLINGKRDALLSDAKPGERLRLRIINAAASSYFYVSLANLPMQVISADGTDIEPINTREILMGMAETYDVLFTLPENKSYELRATAQDVTGHASGWIGSGDKVSAKDKPKPDQYASMDHSKHGGGHSSEHREHDAHANHHGHHVPSQIKVIETLTVDALTALKPTTLPKDAKVHDLKLVLGGDMERYVWHINGKAIQEDRLININKGEVIRFTFENETMMHHPMHLHGHFFRVLNAQGEKSPLKHTVDVPPHGSRVIEFYSNEPGQWMLHCHNLYHMKTGMARVVRYNDYELTPDMKAHDKHDPHLHEHIYHDGRAEVSTNHAQFDFRFSRTRDNLELKLENTGYESEETEGDLIYRRWFSKDLSLVGGATYFDEWDRDRLRATAGVSYRLPMMIETQVLVDHRGDLRLDLEKRFQWTKNFFTDVDFTLREEAKGDFEISLMYANSWSWSAGVMFTPHKAGVGIEYKF